MSDNNSETQTYTIDQSKYFGSSEKVFSTAKLRRHMELDSIMENPNFYNTKTYFLTYYAKSLDNVYYTYNPVEDFDDGLIATVTSCQMDEKWKNIDSVVTYKYNGSIEDFYSYCEANKYKIYYTEEDTNTCISFSIDKEEEIITTNTNNSVNTNSNIGFKEFKKFQKF